MMLSPLATFTTAIAVAGSRATCTEIDWRLTPTRSAVSARSRDHRPPADEAGALEEVR